MRVRRELRVSTSTRNLCLWGELDVLQHVRNLDHAGLDVLKAVVFIR